MKFLLATAALVGTALSLALPETRSVLAPFVQNDDAEVIPDEFIVVFKREAIPENGNVDALIDSVLASAQVQESALIHRYEDGFAAVINEESLESVRSRSEVEFVEPNQVVYAHGVQQNPPSWGLARISQRAFRVRNLYQYPDTAGEGVDVYIIDTVSLLFIDLTFQL
jgi:hypothetical protein